MPADEVKKPSRAAKAPQSKSASSKKLKTSNQTAKPSTKPKPSKAAVKVKPAKPRAKRVIIDAPEQIEVKINPPQKINVHQRAEAPAKDEDIPANILPTADELRLGEDEPEHLSPKQMEKWFDSLDTLEAPIDDDHPLKEHFRINRQDGSDIITLHEKLEVTNEEESSFFQDNVQVADSKQPVVPNIYDTKTVNRPLKVPKKRRNFVSGLLVAIIMIGLGIAVYAAIDMGLLGDNISVPVHILKK